MPRCGSQCFLCDLPIRFDTYKGCTHLCKYCFVQRKNTLDVELGESVSVLKNFVEGKRARDTQWCDWNIPIHWGGMSDPFQPCEKKFKRSLECLKYLAETQYPTVISTKGKLCIESPWIDELEKCNVVMQISMLCSKYDELEPGAPTFEERLEMVRVLSKKVKRVIVRAQPYIHDVFADLMENIPRIAEAGAHGIIFEGMKFVKKKPGLVRCAGDWVQKQDVLKADFERLRDECHKYGLAFYAGENRLRKMGDSLTCCGISDLEGFKPNTFNLNHIMNGESQEPTEKQKEIGTAGCFADGMEQNAAGHRFYRKHSFSSAMKWLYENNREYVNEVFGKKV